MKSRTKLIGFSAAALALGIATYAFAARSEEAHSFGPPFMGHGMGGGMMGSDMMGMAHDSATMAQLRVIHLLFVNHDRINRTVTNLPDGIRTVTESDDPEIAQLLKNSCGRHDEARRRRRRSRTSYRERCVARYFSGQG